MAEKTYTLKATNTECRFDTDELGLSNGRRTFVVKAKAAGYKDSEYSNEVIANVGPVKNGFNLTFAGDYETISSGDRRNDEASLIINGEVIGPWEAKTYTGVNTFSFVGAGEGEVDRFGGTWADGSGFDMQAAETIALTQDLTIESYTH